MFVTYTFSFVLCPCQALVPLDLAVLPSTGTVLSRLMQPCKLAHHPQGWIRRLPWFVLWKAVAARYLNVMVQSKASKGGVPGSSPWNIIADIDKWQF